MIGAELYTQWVVMDGKDVDTLPFVKNVSLYLVIVCYNKYLLIYIYIHKYISGLLVLQMPTSMGFFVLRRITITK